MPTNPLAGFWLCPVDERGDDDYCELNESQRGVWHDIRGMCSRNRKPWVHKGVKLPGWSLITTYAELAQICGVRRKNAVRWVAKTVQRLADCGWIKVQSKANRYTIISLTKSGRWQDFDTYRGKPKANQRRTEGAPAGSGRSDPTYETEKQTTSSPDGPLFAVPDPPPDPDAVAVLTWFRRAMIGAGCDCPGFRDERTFRKKLSGWARQLTGVALDHKSTVAQLAELLRWALAAPSWERDGETWTWARVLDTTEPVRKLGEKVPAMRKSRKRAAQAEDRANRPKLEKYSPGPGAPIMYYANDRKISWEEYTRLGGK